MPFGLERPDFTYAECLEDTFDFMETSDRSLELKISRKVDWYTRKMRACPRLLVEAHRPDNPKIASPRISHYAKDRLRLIDGLDDPRGLVNSAQLTASTKREAAATVKEISRWLSNFQQKAANSSRFIPTAVRKRLDYLAGLPADWDSAGITAVTENTARRARLFLAEAFEVGRSHLPTPSIGVAYDGMVVLEWKTEAGKELIVDIPASASDPIGFLLVEPQLSGEEEIDEEIGHKWPTQGIIRRLLNN